MKNPSIDPTNNLPGNDDSDLNSIPVLRFAQLDRYLVSEDIISPELTPQEATVPKELLKDIAKARLTLARNYKPIEVLKNLPQRTKKKNKLKGKIK